mmetsp:Transcript_97600/g.246226  ORF Transcript_97600/g.246226 Transcript_97600/m.246226 type:complete len:1178 (+) Transcript_97600:1-3534(+)
MKKDTFISAVGGLLNLDIDACGHIFDVVDATGSGEASIVDFVRAVRNSRPVKTLAHLRHVIRRQVPMTNLNDVFGFVDPLGTGSCEVLAFSRWLRALGIIDSDGHYLFNLLDTDKDGLVSHGDFYKLLFSRRKTRKEFGFPIQRIARLQRRLARSNEKLQQQLLAHSQCSMQHDLTPATLLTVCCRAGLSPTNAWDLFVIVATAFPKHCKSISIGQLQDVIGKLLHGSVGRPNLLAQPNSGASDNHSSCIPKSCHSPGSSGKTVTSQHHAASASASPRVLSVMAGLLEPSVTSSTDALQRSPEIDSSSPSQSLSSRQRHQRHHSHEEGTNNSGSVEPMSEKQVFEIANSEARRSALRHVVFDGSMAEFQIAMHCAQDFRRRLLGKAKIFSGSSMLVSDAWRWLQKYRRYSSSPGGRDFDLSDFQSAVTSSAMQLSALDAERVFKVLGVIGGKGLNSFEGFLSAMRFLAPVTSFLDLRRSLVQRYHSVPVALQLIRDCPSGGQRSKNIKFEAFSVDELEVKLLCCAGIVNTSVRWLFKVLDSQQNALLSWKDLEFGLEHAPAYLQLHGLHTSLLKTSKTLQAALIRTKALSDFHPSALEAQVDNTVLTRLGLPQASFGSVMSVLEHWCKDGRAPTMKDLLNQLKAFDGSPPTHDHTTMDAALDQAHGIISAKASTDSSCISDSQWTNAIWAWRKVQPQLLIRFPGGVEEAFAALDSARVGRITFSEWVERFGSSTGLRLSRGSVEALFGVSVGWQHSQWAPNLKANATMTIADLEKSVRLATPIHTLKQLEQRLTEELGSLLQAFESIGGGEQVSLDAWQRFLKNLWVTPLEACKLFVQFELVADGTLSVGAFLRTMRSPEAAMRVHDIAAQLVQQHGSISRAFEGLPLTVSLEPNEFQTSCIQLLGMAPSDARTLCSFYFDSSVFTSGDSQRMQMADLLEIFTMMEDRHYRKMQVLESSNASDIGSEPTTNENLSLGLRCDSGSTTLHLQKVPIRGVALPRLDVSSTGNNAQCLPDSHVVLPVVSGFGRGFDGNGNFSRRHPTPSSATSASGKFGEAVPEVIALPHIGVTSALQQQPCGAGESFDLRCEGSEAADRARRAREWRAVAAAASSRAMPGRPQPLLIVGDEDLKRDMLQQIKVDVAERGRSSRAVVGKQHHRLQQVATASTTVQTSDELE